MGLIMEFKRYNEAMRPISKYLMDVLNDQSTDEDKFKVIEERNIIKDILWKYVNEKERIAADAIFDDIIKHFGKDNV